MANNNRNESDNRRKCLRLDIIFPVELQVIGKEKREPISDMKEGFTRNIGQGGMGIFVKTLKEHDKEMFNFIPHETKLKLIINVPLDSDPIESYATVEWVEKQSGPILDTYFFGVSYDFINEIEYDRIINYVKWLRFKPRLIFLTGTVLVLGLLFSIAFLFEVNIRKIQREKELLVSIAEGKRAEKEKVEAKKNRLEAETALREAMNNEATITADLKKAEDERKAVERRALLSEEDRQHLQAALDEMTEEKADLESRIEQWVQETQSLAETAEQPAETGNSVISPERLNAEENNYKKFRELILDGKIHPLSAYISSHRGSIYHAAALFALAEMRYKAADASLAEANYTQIVELYPESKYALYSSHRLEQLRRSYNYEVYSLQDLCGKYKLPELFDYRSIEPYYRP